MYLGLLVNCPTFYPDFNQFWGSSTDLQERTQFQISHKSIGIRADTCLNTERGT